VRGFVSPRPRPKDPRLPAGLDRAGTFDASPRTRRGCDRALAERGIPPSKKNSVRRGATLVFLDESGFMLTPLARRTLPPRGKTPIQKCWSRHDRISAISAITVSPRRNRLGLYFKLLDDNRNAKAPDIVEFLRLIDRQLQRPLTIIWDRIN